MTKEEVKHEIEEMLESHKEKIETILADGYRVAITLVKDTCEVEVTKAINVEGRKSGIKILHDGIPEEFPSKEALLFVIKKVGFQKFQDNQGNAIIVSRDKPNIAEERKVMPFVDDEGTTWFVNFNSGTDQRIKLLNNVFKRLNMNWKAERT